MSLVTIKMKIPLGLYIIAMSNAAVDSAAVPRPDQVVVVAANDVWDGSVFPALTPDEPFVTAVLTA